MNGGVNTYAYVGGNPVMFVDPLGLQTDTVTKYCQKYPLQCASGVVDIADSIDGMDLSSPFENPGFREFCVASITGMFTTISGSDSGETISDGNPNDLEGEPGSTIVGPDKSRKFGNDGYPETDRERGHESESGKT